MEEFVVCQKKWDIVYYFKKLIRKPVNRLALFKINGKTVFKSRNHANVIQHAINYVSCQKEGEPIAMNGTFILEFGDQIGGYGAKTKLKKEG